MANTYNSRSWVVETGGLQNFIVEFLSLSKKKKGY